MFSRRRLLRTVPLASVAAGLALAGCSGATIQTISADAVTALSAVETGLTDLAPALEEIPGITPAVVASANDYLAQALSVLQSITATTTAAAGQSLISAAEDYVTDGLNLLSGYTLPSGVATVVADLKTALPYVEALAAIVTSVGAAAPNPAAVAALGRLKNAKAILG